MSFAFAALMVHFDAGPSSHHRLRLAVDLAIRFEAALIGIADVRICPLFSPTAILSVLNERTASSRR